MKVLELFAGSRSIGKVAEQFNCDVFSVDINPFDGIDLVKDILDVTKDDIPFVPDVIWASPPCTTFSVSSMGYHWLMDGTPRTESAETGLKILYKTMEIFTWYPDAHYYMENPRGMMRKKVKGLPRTTITYCSYGDKRMKPTDIWSNNIQDLFNPAGWEPKPMCYNGNKNCHHEEAPRGSQSGTQGLADNFEKSIIPEELCFNIIEHELKYFRDYVAKWYIPYYAKHYSDEHEILILCEKEGYSNISEAILDEFVVVWEIKYDEA